MIIFGLKEGGTSSGGGGGGGAGVGLGGGVGVRVGNRTFLCSDHHFPQGDKIK